MPAGWRASTIYLASCNCTIINQDLVGKVIPPHGSILVPSEFHTRDDDGSVGSTLEALLESNGTKYYAKAKITGVVNADYSYRPHDVDFGILRPGECVTQTVTFLPKVLTNFQISGVRSMGSFNVSLCTNKDKATDQLVTVTFHAEVMHSGGVFSGVAQVHTSSKRAPEATIYLNATVRPNIEVVPEILVLPHGGIMGKSRLTIRTIKPSKMIRRTIETKMDYQKYAEVLADDWSLCHVVEISNSSISEAKQINFDLEIENGTSSNEAGSLIVGSSFSALWLWATDKNTLKVSCANCGGHIQFPIKAVGSKIPCPHCQKIMTLHQAENLKMSCYFCKGHIEFPAHAIGEKMPCPHCKMDITLKEFA